MTEFLAEEQAVSYALKQGFGLFRRGHSIYAIDLQGRKHLVTVSHRPGKLWSVALYILKTDPAFNPLPKTWWRKLLDLLFR